MTDENLSFSRVHFEISFILQRIETQTSQMFGSYCLLIVPFLLLLFLFGEVFCFEEKEKNEDNVNSLSLQDKMEFYESSFTFMEKQIQRVNYPSYLQSYSPIPSPSPSPSSIMHHHEIIISIKQQNLSLLKEMILNRSSPNHSQYQQWLTFDEIGQLVTNPISVSKVEEWLFTYNLTMENIIWRSTYQEYLKVNIPIHILERMLQTQFYEFQFLSATTNPNNKNPLKVIRAFQYFIPTTLKEDIECIFNTVQLPPLQDDYQQDEFIFPIERQSSTVKEETGQKMIMKLHDEYHNITVPFLSSYYNLSTNTGSTSSIFQQSVYQMQNEMFSQSDLLNFQQVFNLHQQSAISIGGQDTSSCTTTTCAEGNLSIQYLMGIAQQTESIWWYSSSENGVDPFVNWITNIANNPNPPQSSAVSWGVLEAFLSPSVLTSWETEAMKATGRGVTIVVASGDNGAPGKDISNGNCLCGGQVSLFLLSILLYFP